MMDVITVFGSSGPQPGSEEYIVAYQTGRALATKGFALCNGGYGGTMEAGAKGAKEAGGATIGVTSSVFSRSVNPWIDQEVKTRTMIDRLLKLVELGQGYVVLNGGTGTLLELAAVWEFINKGFQPVKPIILLGSFWRPVVDSIRGSLMAEGVANPNMYIKNAGSPDECADILVQSLGKG